MDWNKSSGRIAIIVLVFLAGGVSGFYFRPYYSRTVRTDTYPFINPSAGVKYPAEKEPTESKILKQTVSDLIAGYIKDKQAMTASVYFRAFGSGQWMGVNEDRRYAPASLLKVPLMITYYKLDQVVPGTLKKKITYNGGPDLNAKETIKASSSLEPGTYTITDLVNRMIALSGNNSANVLEKNIDNSFYKEVYTDLGLPFPYDQADVDFITPKSYAIVLRALYNATYLNRELSNQALSLMDNVDFQDGLVAGVPKSIRVAHKFGERAFGSTDRQGNPKLITKAELHDCGIIYYPNNTYILCVMTAGKDFKKLESVIAGISKTIYTAVASENQLKPSQWIKPSTK